MRLGWCRRLQITQIHSNLTEEVRQTSLCVISLRLCYISFAPGMGLERNLVSGNGPSPISLSWTHLWLLQINSWNKTTAKSLQIQGSCGRVPPLRLEGCEFKSMSPTRPLKMGLSALRGRFGGGLNQHSWVCDVPLRQWMGQMYRTIFKRL